MTWPNYAHPVLTMTPSHVGAMGLELTSAGSLATAIAASVAYPTANLAFFHSIWVPTPCTIVQMFAYNGATVSGNIDVGLYAMDGTRLVSSGSTAQAGTNVLQAFDVTDTTIGPGEYYLAIAMDNTTGTLFRFAPGIRLIRPLGCLSQASAFALPATATFAALSGGSYVPIYGFSTRAVL